MQCINMKASQTMQARILKLAAILGATASAAFPAAAQQLREDALSYFEPIPQGPVTVDGALPSSEQIELGKMLFFEPRLSEGHNISCNTCHNLGTGGADLATVSIGHRWQKGGRNSPTVFNAVFNTAQFWDGRAADLADQAGGPMVNPVEMGSTQEHVMEMLTGIPGYASYFAAAFPTDGNPLTFENAREAIAAFETTLVTPNAPFDLFLRGDDTALSETQKAGLQLFMDSGCTACHNGINLGGDSYQPFGVVEKPEWSVLPPDDRGRYEVTRSESDAYVFKVPTLRNIELTLPYFHSGAVWNLADAVEIMGVSQLGEALSSEDAAKITAFLTSLTGDEPVVTYPALPPSTADTPRPQQ